MKLRAALEYEKVRSNDDGLNRIILHKDGKFYHAYEWSAWLIKTIVCTEEIQQERGDAKLLQVFRYKTKDTEYIMLGFPVDVIGKFIPNYTNCEPIKDSNDLSIEIELPEESNYEEMLEEFDSWKQTCEEKLTKKNLSNAGIKHDTRSADLSRSGLFGIITKILAYPLERATQVQNIEFIGNLKSEASALL